MNHPKKSKKNWNYEESVTKVEDMINEIESGNLSLEDVFEKFAIAAAQLQQCEAFLQQGKNRMELLIETLDDNSEIEF